MADVTPLKLVDLGSGEGELREFASGDTVPVSGGGTGATDGPTALANLGLSDTDGLAEGSSNLWFTVARVRAAVLTGLSTATNAAITATDTVLQAFGKLQAQVTSLGSTKVDKVFNAVPGYALKSTGYVTDSPYQAVYLADLSSHGDTARITAYHQPGTTAFIQLAVGSNVFRFYRNGDAAKAAAGSWIAVSDERLKDNIAPWTLGLEEILLLQPKRWNFKPGSDHDPEQEFVGLIAQEAEQVAPRMVRKQYDKMGEFEFEDMRFIDDSDLKYMLVNAVQTLHARLEAAEAEIATLKAA